MKHTFDNQTGQKCSASALAGDPKRFSAAKSHSDKKEFLLRYGDNEKEIKRLEEELECWESRAERVNACFGSIGRTGGGDRIQYAIDNLCELRAALYDRLVDSTALRLEIERCIASVSDDRLRLILEYRYISGMTWENIAETLHIDYRWALRLHNRALEHLETPPG